MNGRRKKLFVASALTAVAGLVWAGTASSAPPDPTTGQFDLVGTTTIVNVVCDAPGGTGTVTNSLELTVVPDPVTPPNPGTGIVAPEDVGDVTGYQVVGSPTIIPLNGSATINSPGDTQSCPDPLPADVPLSFFVEAIGAATQEFAGFNFTLHFELAGYGA